MLAGAGAQLPTLATPFQLNALSRLPITAQLVNAFALLALLGAQANFNALPSHPVVPPATTAVDA